MNIPEGWKPVPVKETHEMRTAFREAEKGALLSGHDHIEAFFCGYRAMLAAAPTPPAQEDEPVYQSSWDKVYWADISKAEFVDRQGVLHTRTLYTRPDNSELRKAAWKYLKSNSYGTAEERRRDLENLRAALEGK